MKNFRLLLGALLLLIASSVVAQPSIVLIIDDLGYSYDAGVRTVKLPGSVTCAVLPHSPNSTSIANYANDAGKEVMVHAPMTSVHKYSPGPGALSPTQSYSEFVDTLAKGIRSVPHAVGLNNHMGSELTQQADYMGLVMNVIREHDLFFIDSRTSKHTVAATTAELYGIQNLSRDVFLDNVRTESAIHTAFQTLIQKARKQGLAVGIGHPYRETLAYLEKALPSLQQQGIKLIPASQAIKLAYGSDENSQLAQYTK